ncbi:MAG: hypothetical protein J6386_18465 [Candidatus Synoicihabitans palmerolidicus]|nr:hypothetical protein [Candidatus Synoicihabitans palmerolidicus]
MCRNQEILPVSASLFLRYLFIYNLLRLWDTLYLRASRLWANSRFNTTSGVAANQPPVKSSFLASR